MPVPGPSHAEGDDLRSDAQLVDAANTGDAAAFESLYRRHRDWVARLAYRFTADHDGALDVTQETFLYLLRKFPGLQLRGRLTTLLYPAVKHLARDWRRKRDRQAAGGDALEAVPSHAPADAEDGRDELDAVLDHLSEAHREVLLMRYIDDMSLDEIATALALPLGTVKSRLHHAVAAARRGRQSANRRDAD
ncbi:MAG: sigma-70 family RNA polymerase sigma factor [Phycisphaeraceae bacterium]